MVVREDEIGRYQLRFLRAMASIWKIAQGCFYEEVSQKSSSVIPPTFMRTKIFFEGNNDVSKASHL